MEVPGLLRIVRLAAVLLLVQVIVFPPNDDGELNAAEPEFDLVIRNGKIIDGTGNPWFFGDLGLRGDRIVVISRVPLQGGKQVIEAKGLVVCPGFIDIHSHSDTLVLEDGAAHSKIRQGVTTEVLGEGDSVAPSLGKLGAKKLSARGKDLSWSTLGQYFETIEKEGVAVNVASYVGLGTVWRCVMGDSFERPTKEQLDEMKKIVRDAMDDGAMGLSSMLAMPPGSLATSDDIVELCGEVAAKGGIYSTHIRNEGTDVFIAVEEAIRIGERARLPVDIIHLKIADQQYWGRMNEVIGMIEAARKRGVNVQANVYPYTRGNNDLASIVPPWAHEGGVVKMLERIRDATTRERIKKDIRGGIPGWYNHYTAVGGDWSRMLISKETTFKGLTMDRVLAERQKARKNPPGDLLDEFLDYLTEEGGSVSTVYAHHTEEDMTLAMSQPWCSIGSDGLAFATQGPLRRGHPHPRSFGTFPRVLGVYVRETGVLKLEDAIRKMTSLNAAKIGLHDRGTLEPGHAADIVVFDPAKIIDHATYTDPFEYPDGIEHVIVNGQVVIDQGKLTDQRPGKGLRHTVNAISK